MGKTCRMGKKIKGIPFDFITTPSQLCCEGVAFFKHHLPWIYNIAKLIAIISIPKNKPNTDKW